MMFLLIVIGSAIVIMAFVIIDSMRRKGDFSLNNNDKPACSKCGFNIPFEDENPRTRWKCPVCGEKVGFWGTDVQATTPKAELPELKEERSIQDFKNPLDEKGRTPVERVLDDQEKDEDVERDEH